jgi:hypothetical protein
MKRAILTLGLSFLIACGTTSAPPIPSPQPTPAQADMAAGYCHPCCAPGDTHCSLACVDCMSDACEPSGGGYCCDPARLRALPDGGSLCPH